MKNFHILFSIILFSVLWACNSGEKTQEKKQGLTKDFSSQTSSTQREALNQWLSQYFNIKNALVATDPVKAAESAVAFSSLIQNTATEGFQGEALSFLSLHKGELITYLAKTAQTQDVEAQRLAFVRITQSMYELTKAFKPNAQKVYYQFCPMAFNDKGGYWLNEQEKVYNPYFGNKMLHCGKVEESF